MKNANPGTKLRTVQKVIAIRIDLINITGYIWNFKFKFREHYIKKNEIV